MSEVARRETAKAFTDLGQMNPLRKLSERDRELLWACLKLYRFLQRQDSDPSGPEERAARAMRDATKLADSLETDIFQGPLALVLCPLYSGFEILPVMLRAIAKSVGEALDLAGKPGRKDEVFTNQQLVMVSELVRLMTGNPNDEHLAELLQGIDESESADFSGDAIRKKRKYLQEHYPELYESTVQRAGRLFNSAPATAN